MFKALGVEEPSIILNLYIDNSISASTLKYVLNDYKKFLSELLFGSGKKKPRG